MEKNHYSSNLNSKIPEGPIENKWTQYKNKIDLVSPANKRKLEVLVVGTGLAGGSAAEGRQPGDKPPARLLSRARVLRSHRSWRVKRARQVSSLRYMCSLDCVLDLL